MPVTAPGNGRFAGKVTMVAGGASGIGAATCREFAASGATVVCADIAADRARELVAGLSGEKHLAVVLDAGSADSWTETVSATIRQFDRLDVLVTSLYSGKETSVASMTPAEWDDSFRVTSTGVFLGIHAVRERLSAGGAIVNISSIAAHGRGSGNAGYGAAKAAAASISRSAAPLLAGRGIRVNVVTPGLVRTPALERTLRHFAGEGGDPGAIERAFLARVPLQRVADAEEVARAVAFLASDDASYITGADLVVDGGMLTV